MTIKLLTLLKKHLGKLLQLFALLFAALRSAVAQLVQTLLVVAKPTKTYRLVLPFLALLYTSNIFGQWALGYTKSNVAGTYTAISGTSIIAANSDDVNSTVQNIGFTFNYGGVDFTQFIASSNGYIVLGSTAPTTTNYTPLSSTNNSIAGVANNGRIAATTGSVQFSTSGTSPNRICTIQYTNFDLLNTLTTRRVSFQIKLYETTNVINIIYTGAIGTTTSLNIQVGIRGGSATEFNNYTGSIANWAGLTSGTANTSTIAYGSSNNATRSMPSNGRTLIWTPPTRPSNDQCSGATTLACGTTNLAGTTVGATSKTPPASAPTSNYGVWYTFAGSNQNTTITSTATGWDHEMTVLSGSCAGLTQIGTTDLGASGGTESYSFYAATGTTYYVWIAHYDPVSTTTGPFTISRTCVTPPANDACSNATSLTVGAAAIAGTLNNAAFESPFSSKKDVWYKFVACAGSYTINLTGMTSDEDVYIYTACGTSSSVASGTSTSTTTESATFTATSGTYYIQVQDFDNNGGNFNIAVTGPACSPAITTSGTLSPFSACANVVSSEQSFTVSGSNLTANLVVTAPTGFQVSTSSGSGFATSVSLTPSGGSVASTTIYVRMSAQPTSPTSGNIACTSTSATTQNVAVSGTVSALSVGGTASSNQSICSESQPANITWVLKARYTIFFHKCMQILFNNFFIEYFFFFDISKCKSFFILKSIRTALKPRRAKY